MERGRRHHRRVESHLRPSGRPAGHHPVRHDFPYRRRRQDRRLPRVLRCGAHLCLTVGHRLDRVARTDSDGSAAKAGAGQDAIGWPDGTHRTAPEHERPPPAMNTSMHSRYRLADKAVWRVGYGAMQLAGDGVFGPPRDRYEAIAVLRAAVDAGVDHIDTAQYYGPGVVNELIREALHPYPDGLALVSKVAARRDESGAVLPYDDPDQLRASIEDNLATLGVEQLTAVNLRVLDNAVPDQRFVDQLGALVAARDEGLIAGVGVSNVTHRHLLMALEVTDIVCVQNVYNLANRTSAPVLEEC